MAVEARRGCGYRKVGGIYLVGGGVGMECCKLPILLTVCPCCGNGIKQSRGWQWIDPKPWIAGSCTEGGGRALICPLAGGAGTLGDKVGLLWIGTQFYPTPEHFVRESASMGISRRIKSVPRGFVVGESWVFLAHPKVRPYTEQVPASDSDPAVTETVQKWKAGVFRIFKPTALEIIITTSQSQDPDFMADLAKRKLTPVVVPDDDKDHQGSVYDSDDAEEPALELEGGAS